MSVPVIDLDGFLHGGSAARLRILETLDHALRCNGFFLLRRHGVPKRLVAELQRVSRQFFALPPEDKRKVAQPNSQTMRGYVAMGRESLAYSRDRIALPDLNESFMMGQPQLDRADGSFAPNIWPHCVPLMRTVWTEYYCEMESLAATLLRMFAAALRIADDFFDDKFASHTSRLRARYYPRQREKPEPGQLRAGAHTDYGSLAILATEDRPGGLQVREATGQWIDVPASADCFIVNIGDLLARWTNDRWPAALHRVVNPPPGTDGETGRLSHIYFQSPSDGALVECLEVCCDAGRPPRYPPVHAGEYLRTKFRKVDQTGDKR